MSETIAGLANSLDPLKHHARAARIRSVNVPRNVPFSRNIIVAQGGLDLETIMVVIKYAQVICSVATSNCQ